MDNDTCKDKFKQVWERTPTRIKAEKLIRFYLQLDNPEERLRDKFYLVLRGWLPEAMETDAFEELFYAEMERVAEAEECPEDLQSETYKKIIEAAGIKPETA